MGPGGGGFVTYRGEGGHVEERGDMGGDMGCPAAYQTTEPNAVLMQATVSLYGVGMTHGTIRDAKFACC